MELSQFSNVHQLASIMSKSVLPQYSVMPLKTFPSGGSIFAYAANERKVSFKYPSCRHISSCLWQSFPLSVKVVQAFKHLRLHVQVVRAQVVSNCPTGCLLQFCVYLNIATQLKHLTVFK